MVTINVDINGVRVASAPTEVGKDGSTTQYSQSVNGQMLPQEQLQTKVLSENTTEKVTETWDRKYDIDGRLNSTERIVRTERKLAGGVISTSEAIFRADPNGGMVEKERKTVETRPRDSHSTSTVTTSTEITISVPNSSGGFETLEQHKILATTEKSSADASTMREETTIYRRSPNGDLLADRRSVKDARTSGDKTEEIIAKYEADSAGHFVLRNQETSKAVTAKDGTLALERSLFSVPAEGSPNAGRPQLIEQQSIVREPGPNNTVREKVNVRRAGLEDSGRPGPPTQLSETVCTGKCDVWK